MGEALEIDVFWSFRSPWSYLATGRLRQWQEQFQLKVNFRPVYPIAIRTPEFFHQVNPLWGPYFQQDLRRVAAMLEIPLTWPNPDPVRQYRGDDGLPYTHEDQPHIYRLTRLGIVAEELGKGIEFADEVGNAIWRGQQDWHEGEHLSLAANSAGLDLAEMDKMVADDADRLEQVIMDNQDAHTACGHWGVPTMAFKEEPFFGQDRLDVLMWRLESAGLQKR